jgi:hypothetical protein
MGESPMIHGNFFWEILFQTWFEIDGEIPELSMEVSSWENDLLLGVVPASHG